jgi:ankyrin repeat protein
MSAPAIKSLLVLNIVVMMSASACSSNGGNLAGRNRNTSPGEIASVSTTATPQASKRELNEQLFRRLSKILVSEAGNAESPDDLLAVSSLLDQGADVDARNSAGQTPLLAAAQNGHVKAMEILLSRGADVNAQDHHGRTALMVAAGADDVKMVKLLLSKGAKVNLKDESGFTALSGSEVVGGSDEPQHLEIRRLLRRSGAK